MQVSIHLDGQTSFIEWSFCDKYINVLGLGEYVDVPANWHAGDPSLFTYTL